MAKILIKYGLGEQYSLEGQGFVGTQCDVAMKSYEERQGVSPGDRTPEADLSQPETEEEQQRER